ncbi:MAG: helix-turn-helix domain-containing protein [Acidimicrobiales bacterium]
MATDVVLTRWRTESALHETAVRAAYGAARPAVRGYVGYEELLAGRMSRREVARLGVALILAFGDALDVHDAGRGSIRSFRAFVLGNQSRSSLTEFGGHQHGVQVELTPPAARALFGNVGELNDVAVAVAVDEAMGSRGVRLVERVGEAATWEERFSVLDETFGALARTPPGKIAPEVEWMRRQLVRSGGRARVVPLMDATGWSRRVVTERFRTQLGVAPKMFARIVRFQRAAAMLQEPHHGRTIADVAVECGYYDQSHLTREFSVLAGRPPGVVLAESTGQPSVRFLQDDEMRGAVP